MASEGDRPVGLRGRGGIGNYYAQQSINEARATEDLEAQKSIPQTDLSLEFRPVQEYTRSGRGGIGNFYSHSDLEKIIESSPKVGKLLSKVESSGGARYSGRGGAGNFSCSDQSSTKTEAEISVEDERKRHDEVVRDVELGLKPPEKAYLRFGGGNDEVGIHS